MGHNQVTSFLDGFQHHFFGCIQGTDNSRTFPIGHAGKQAGIVVRFLQGKGSY